MQSDFPKETLHLLEATLDLTHPQFSLGRWLSLGSHAQVLLLPSLYYNAKEHCFSKWDYGCIQLTVGYLEETPCTPQISPTIFIVRPRVSLATAPQ